MTRMRTIAAADPKGQLRDWRKRSTRALPTKKTLPPPSKAGMTYSPMMGMKTSIAPLSRPAALSGRVTWREGARGPAAGSPCAGAEDEQDDQRDDEQEQVPGARRRQQEGGDGSRPPPPSRRLVSFRHADLTRA